MTDHNEAMRLADELVAPIGTQTSYQTAHEAAALIRKQAERIAELEKMQDESSDVEASLRDQVAAVTADLKSARAETNRIIALLDAANDERKALRAEVERYRHLREGSGWPAVFASHDAPEPLRGDDLETAIDTARKATQ